MRTHVSIDIMDDVAHFVFTSEVSGKPPTLDYDVMNELHQGIRQIESAEPKLRAVIVRSEPEKYFVVGANINALEKLDAHSIVPWVKRGHEVFNALEALPLPVIAQVTGFALGGGLELAMACDMIIATDTAKFGQPEARLGLVPGWGGTYRLPRRVGLAKAKELSFTGRVVDATEAFQMGLVDFVGDIDTVSKHVSQLLDGIRESGAQAVANVKRLLNNSLSMILEQNCKAEADESVRCLLDDEAPNRISEFLESRKR